jgi:peptide/nickel transport system substrate-binding protein
MNVLYGLLLSILAVISSYLPNQTYIEGVLGQPSSFYPGQISNQTDKTISSLVYRGLFKYDIFGTTIPDLAETWSISVDGLTYTIKIKDKQYWTNGKKISADDLIYTSFMVSDLSGVATDRIDDLTVRYTLPNKYAPFLSLLTVGVMPANSLEKGSALVPITSGDYRIARIDKSGNLIKQLVLITQSNKYAVKKIVFRYYSNEDELVSAAKIGEIDAFLSNKVYDIQNFKDRKYPIQGIYYALFFNTRLDKFKDYTLRQKLEKVLPISKFTVDLGILTQGAISRSLFTNKNIPIDKYDEKYTGDLSNLDFVVTIPDLPEHQVVADMVTKNWEDKLGIITEVKKVDPENIVKEVIEPRNFEVLLYGQEVGRDPDRYVLWHSSQKDRPGLNISDFEQIRADRALEEGRNELNNDKRLVHYSEFQKTVSEQVPAIFLYHPYVHFYVSKYIEGIGDKYTFSQGDRFLDMNNWTRILTN